MKVQVKMLKTGKIKTMKHVYARIYVGQKLAEYYDGPLTALSARQTAAPVIDSEPPKTTDDVIDPPEKDASEKTTIEGVAFMQTDDVKTETSPAAEVKDKNPPPVKEKTSKTPGKNANKEAAKETVTEQKK